MTKIVKIEEVKIHIFRKTWWISVKFFWKNITYDDIEVTRKQRFASSLHSFLKYILRIKAWIFLNEPSILGLFYQISNLSFYFSKNELRQNLLGKSRGKRYNAWYMSFEYHVQNHWVAPRSTQTFIHPGLIKLVLRISRNLVIKSKLTPRSGCSLKAVDPHP